jgi:hypothetical protein
MASSLRAALFFSFALALGCGGGKQGGGQTVEGKVTVNGQPAAKMSIILTDKGGHEYRTFTLDDGTYSLGGVPDGDMQVSFEPPINTGAAMAAQMKKMKGEKLGDAKEHIPDVTKSDGARTKIATKYTHAKTSGLTWAVSKDSRTKDFDLTEK